MKKYPQNWQETQQAVRDLSEHRVKRSPWARKVRIKRETVTTAPQLKRRFDAEPKPWEMPRPRMNLPKDYSGAKRGLEPI